MIDDGKITVQLRADRCTLDDAREVAENITRIFKGIGLGSVTAVRSVDHEPFTTDSELHGLEWIEIEMFLDRSIALLQLVGLLKDSGVPASSHLTYTDRMHLSGYTLS